MEAASVLITPDSLRADAATARIQSERLRVAAHDKLTEAVRLEREADALERALELAPAEGEATNARAELGREVMAWLARCRKPKSSTEVAERFDVTQTVARETLAFLVDAGTVHRSGLKRGTRYRLLRDGETAPTPQPFGQRWHEHVRDAAKALGTFTQAEIEAELEHVSAQSVYRWLRRLVDDGLLECERVGHTNMYAYVPPEAQTPQARRRVDPSPSAGRRRGSVVIGSGADRGSRAEVREILRAAKRHGDVTVKEQKHGYAIVRDDEVITSIPRTPSDHRSLKNARAKLNGAGIDA